jgi:hypothetical protein
MSQTTFEGFETAIHFRLGLVSIETRMKPFIGAPKDGCVGPKVLRFQGRRVTILRPGSPGKTKQQKKTDVKSHR